MATTIKDTRTRYILVKEHGTYVNIIASQSDLKPVMDILIDAEVPIIIVTLVESMQPKTHICISKHNYNSYFAGSNMFAVSISDEFALINVFGSKCDIASNKLGCWKLLKMFSTNGINVDLVMSGPRVFITVPLGLMPKFKSICERHCK